MVGLIYFVFDRSNSASDEHVRGPILIGITTWFLYALSFWGILVWVWQGETSRAGREAKKRWGGKELRIINYELFLIFWCGVWWLKGCPAVLREGSGAVPTRFPKKSCLL